MLLANYPTDDPVAEIKRRQDRKRALRREAAAYAAQLPRSGRGQALSSRKISPAARTVASMSLSLWARETKAASNCAGGK